MSDTPEEFIAVPDDFPADAMSTSTKATDLARAKEAIAGPIPLMPEQPDTIVMLPQGYRHGGVYQTKAEVRELTGVDEEILARTKEFVDFFDTMVALGTIRIGDYDMSDFSLNDRKGVLQTLLLGERERLLLAVIQATYGDTKTLSFVCTACNTDNEFDLILSQDLEIKEVDDLQPSYTYTTSKGDLIEFRLVNGADQNGGASSGRIRTWPSRTPRSCPAASR